MKAGYDFTAAYGRIKEIVGTDTQRGVSRALGIRQSSVFSAIARKSIPAIWLIKLLEKHHINPEYVLHGEAHVKFLVPSDTDGASHEISGCGGEDSMVPGEGIPNPSLEMSDL